MTILSILRDWWKCNKETNNGSEACYKS
jgi:hypothetical protein